MNVHTPADETAAPAVWVLGASMGGPPAVKRFLAQLPAEMPVSFVLAQHLSAFFVPVLVEQLQRVCALNVVEASAGLPLRPGQVVVAPVAKRLMVNDDGTLSLRENQVADGGSACLPCIDDVIEQVVGRMGERAGVIIFSGMGSDGASASQRAHMRGATIWAQTAHSSDMGSMPQEVVSTGCVSFEGEPEELAERLLAQIRVEAGVNAGTDAGIGRTEE